MATNDAPLTSLLISPSREIAEAFLRAIGTTPYFQVVSDMKAYPTVQVLELRVKQWQPEVLLVDLVSSLDEACDLIRGILEKSPGTQVIGLHHVQDGDSVVRALRAGAREFLWEPFESAAQQTAFERLAKLRKPTGGEQDSGGGQVIAFASTKPGSGASTLAAQSAFAIQRLSGKKVLLMDLDLMGGTVGFCLKLQHGYSSLDIFEADPGTKLDLEAVAAQVENIHVIPGPDEPFSIGLDPGRMQTVFEQARRQFDYVIVDLPTIFHRNALQAISEADSGFLVTTAELPSLHLTRKAIEMLDGVGFDRARYGILVNRLSKREGLAAADVEKMFGAAVNAVLPNDYFSLHRIVTRGGALHADAELGKAIEDVARRMTGVGAGRKGKSKTFWGIKPVFSIG